MKKQLFTFSLVLAMASNMIAFNELSMFDETSQESKWVLIEKKFITQPSTEKKLIWTHINSAATLLFAGGTLGTYAILSSEQCKNKLSEQIMDTGNILAGFGTAATFMSATSALDCYLSTRANRNTIASFFNNYDENRFFVPSELEEAFDLIAESIELFGQESILNEANEIVELIQFHVMRHFEKRYEKVLQITAVNAVADAKTVTEVLKNSIECVGKLGGSSK